MTSKDFLDFFKPYSINSKRIRLDPQHDGGYVIPEIALEKCSCLFIYGVGWSKDYEDDFTKKYKKPAYLFDHTIEGSKIPADLIYFHKEGLGEEIDANHLLNSILMGMYYIDTHRRT